MDRALTSLVLLTTLSLAAGCGEPEQVVSAPAATPPNSTEAPPVISGGTLLVTRDGTRAVAADAAVDSVFAIDLASQEIVQEFAFEVGDEPGRVLEARDGEVLV